MVATALETTIQLSPPTPRSRGLLVDAALDLTAADTSSQGRDRLGLGVQHTPWGVTPLRTGNLDCSADVILVSPPTGAAFDGAPAVIDGNVEGSSGVYGKSAALGDFDATAVHPAFKIVDGLVCSTLSFPDANSDTFTSMTGRLQRRMRTQSSAALTFELITGWASNGPSLTSEATTLTASAGMVKAAEEVEEHLAEVLHGNAGLVFIPPRLLHYAVDVGWARIEGGQLYTATGHRVVADAGHTGVEGPSAPGAGAHWIFASGDVAYRVSDTMLLGDYSHDTFDSTTNLRERLAEAYAQLAFDPATVGATLVTIA